MEKMLPNEVKKKLLTMEGWSYAEEGINKQFKFKDFKEAIATMVKIGEVAEELNHHPEWFNVYNRLDIRLSTHDAGGVTSKDFELAQKIESIVAK